MWWKRSRKPSAYLPVYCIAWWGTIVKKARKDTSNMVSPGKILCRYTVNPINGQKFDILMWF